jgi:hypothetical protein
VLGALVLLACLALGWQTYRRPEIGLGAIGVAFIVSCLFGHEQSSLTVGGINAYTGDLAALIVFEAAMLRLVARPWRTWGLPILGALALCLTLFQSFARGIFALGLKAAGLGFRGTFITYAFLLFGLAFLDLPKFQDQVKTGMKILFIFLVGTIFIRWTLVATGLHVNLGWGTSTGVEARIPMRVVNAGEALLLGQIALIWLGWRRYEWAAGLGLSIVILLQHRSVWLTVLAGGGYLLYFQYRKAGGIGLSARTLGALALFPLLIGAALTQLPGIRSALEASTADEGTWVWRVASWASALAPDQMPAWAWVIGKPFGSPSTRFMLGSIVDVGFHNHYVATVVNTGLLGLAAWLVLWGLAWRGAQMYPWAIMLVLSQLVYGVPYSIEGIQGLILALALSPGLGSSPGEMRF